MKVVRLLLILLAEAAACMGAYLLLVNFGGAPKWVGLLGAVGVGWLVGRPVLPPSDRRSR